MSFTREALLQKSLHYHHISIPIAGIGHRGIVFFLRACERAQQTLRDFLSDDGRAAVDAYNYFLHRPPRPLHPPLDGTPHDRPQCKHPVQEPAFEAVSAPAATRFRGVDRSRSNSAPAAVRVRGVHDHV